MEIKISEGRVESIDVIAEVSLLQQRVLHRPGRGMLGQHLHPAARGALSRHWGILRDAGLSPELPLSLPSGEQALRVRRVLHQRGGDLGEALGGCVTAWLLLPPQQSGQGALGVQSCRGGVDAVKSLRDPGGERGLAQGMGLRCHLPGEGRSCSARGAAGQQRGSQLLALVAYQGVKLFWKTRGKPVGELSLDSLQQELWCYSGKGKQKWWFLCIKNSKA